MNIGEPVDNEFPVLSWEDGPAAQLGLPFWIGGAGDRRDQVGDSSHPSRTDYYRILFLKSGSGNYHIDFDAFPIAANTAILVNPGQVTFADSPEDLDGVVLGFPEDFLTVNPSRDNVIFEMSFLQSEEREPVVRFDVASAEEIKDLIDSISVEYRHRRSGFLTVVRSFLHILLVRASRGIRATVESGPVSSAVVTTRRFRRLVSHQVRTVRSVNAFAQQLGISPGHLHDVVKTSTGMTPSELIQQELMQEAKRLLAHTDMSVAEVGHQLGFEDPAYFGRYFRRNQKVSPGQYRSEVRKEFWPASTESAA